MSLKEDLENIPQFKRGKVWCITCGRTKDVNALQCLFSNGWPKCCDETMTLDSPEERKICQNTTLQEKR